MSRPVEAVSYRALLRLPGAMPAFAAAALVRLSYAMVGLSFLLVVQDATGSFGAAGAALGAFALPTLVAPYKSRLVDRFGVRLPLRGLGAGYATMLAAVVVCAATGVQARSPYLLLALAAGVLTPRFNPGPLQSERCAAVIVSRFVPVKRHEQVLPAAGLGGHQHWQATRARASSTGLVASVVGVTTGGWGATVMRARRRAEPATTRGRWSGSRRRSHLRRRSCRSCRSCCSLPPLGDGGGVAASAGPGLEGGSRTVCAPSA